MFYSQLLLSKKGSLGTIWTAAHCYSKLRKHQVQQTDIPSSVDKILVDGVPVIAHRILAYLLLGVVRIYSKKVEYLFHDCNDVLSKLCEFNTGKRTRVSIAVHGYTPRARHHSVKRPTRFALDEFNLELLENRDLMDGNIRPPEQLLLTAGQGEEGSTSDMLYKDKMQYLEVPSTSYTPPRDVLSPHPVERKLSKSPSRNIFISTASPVAFGQGSFSLEDRLEPMELDEAEEEQMGHKSSTYILDNLDMLTCEKGYKSVAGLSKDNSNVVQSSKKDEVTVAEPMALDATENELMNDMPDDNMVPSLEKDQVTVAEPMVLDATENESMNDMADGYSEHETGYTEILRLCFVRDKAHKGTGSVDKEESVGTKKMNNVEMDTPKSKKRQRPEERHISISVDVTPDSKIAGGVVGTLDIASVRTPAPRESAKIFKKRKVVIDSSLVVLNKEYKNWLNNSKDLMRKGGSRVPQTCLRAWRAHNFCRMAESILDPLIPSEWSSFIQTLGFAGNFVDLCPLESNRTAGAERQGHLENHENVASQEDHGCSMEVKSPITCEEKEQAAEDTQKLPEDTPVAPATPVTQVHSNPLRSHENEADHVGLELVVHTSSSLERMEEASHSIGGVELDAVFYTEDANSSGGNGQENGAYSERTRMAETYLHKNFLLKKKQKEDEVLNLSQLLSGKTKKESARLFYEILVLKTRDCIELEQERAYDDIHLRKTSKFVES